MSQNVFTYGSNMCSGRFRAYGVHPLGTGRTAVLTGYRLLFNKPSTDRSGKANVEPERGARAWGVLYSIPDAELQMLDDGEVGYERMALPIRTMDDLESIVWVYVASRATQVGLYPYTWYKRFIVEGAKEHGLPPEYITILENIDALQDADTGRDRRKRALKCQAEP